MGIFGKIFGKKDDEFADFGLGDNSFDKGGDPFADSTANQFGSPEPGLTPAMPEHEQVSQRQQFSGQDMNQMQGNDFSPDTTSFPQHEPQRAQPTIAPSHSGSIQPQPQAQFQQFDNNAYVISKNLEIISYKLDALRAAIDSLSQRVANLERIASEEPRNRGGW
jgi:hypothetical protein